ncbi:MAG: aminodeoxychorismate synthase component I [Methylococcaceae bacterium]|nr:aminodeoxychorismate synthase component I [Methylococcaceae bacterium]
MPLLNPLIHQLPYVKDSATVFTPLAAKPWAIFLDSGFPYSQQGRYDIMSSDPVATLVTKGAETTLITAGTVCTSTEDPFSLLKQQLLNHNFPVIPGLPFNGGALGYCSYDLARRLEKLPTIAQDTEKLPEMAMGIYHWAIVVDHQLQQSWLVGQHLNTQAWQQLIARFSDSPTLPAANEAFKVTGAIVSNMDQPRYSEAFGKVKAYLKAGDCYQINLSQRFSAPCSGNLWTAYQRLRQLNAAPFSAYLNLPEGHILCSSPERFLKVIDGKVETKPIKGTRPRKTDPFADQAQIDALSNSAKDRAENVMIVDLLRNDLSKNCRMGSVKVPKLFAIESYATVHHLVSTVTGVLADGQHAVDLLRSCFPGGSITGAPKIRAMEIIEELEPHRRGIYCGAIGYIGFNGNMDTNIAIRTLVHSKQTIRCWAGGGIVNDSVLAEEYQESFDKAEALLRLLREMMA